MTYAQAQTLCKRFQYLCGKALDPHLMGKGIIECVAVAPFDESHKWMFAQLYRELEDPVKALSLYKGSEFDVILLAFPLLRKRGINYTELRKYISTYYGAVEVATYKSVTWR
jgi:hypothetical protein